jgi:predicted transcriptional regulator
MNNLTIRISDELKAQFIEKAKAEGTTATALIQKWMHDYINGTDSTKSTNTELIDEEELTALLNEVIKEQSKQIRRITILETALTNSKDGIYISTEELLKNLKHLTLSFHFLEMSNNLEKKS